MSLYFEKFNRYMPIMALLASMIATIFLGMANYSIALTQTKEVQGYVLYSSSPTQIQVVPLVTTGLPDLTTGVTVTTTAACAIDTRPPGNTILPLTGEWISVWWNASTETACYSRFSANSSGGYDETHLGVWSYQGGIIGTDDFNEDGYDDLVFNEKIEPETYQYYTVLGQPDGSFDLDTFEHAPDHLE